MDDFALNPYKKPAIAAISFGARSNRNHSNGRQPNQNRHGLTVTLSHVEQFRHIIIIYKFDCHRAVSGGERFLY